MKPRFTLYTGSHCPLCEKARDLVLPLLPSGQRLVEVNVESDPALYAAYGMRIPVFAVVTEEGATVAEKGWPFTPGQVKRMVEGSF